MGYWVRSPNFWTTILLFEAVTIPVPFSNKVVTNYQGLLADCRCAPSILNEMMNKTIRYHSVARLRGEISGRGDSAGKPCLRSQEPNQPAVYACKPRKGQDVAAAQQKLCLFEVNHTYVVYTVHITLLGSRYWLVRLSA
jgi:hypothetical protein